jgi:hypothetical protein
MFCTTEPRVEIRVANESKIQMENVRVQFSSQTEEYGSIPPQGVTDYRAVTKAYRYARIEATVDGEQFLIQPIDFVGEKELKAGKYTYVLKLNDNWTSKFDRLRLSLRKD